MSHRISAGLYKLQKTQLSAQNTNNSVKFESQGSDAINKNGEGDNVIDADFKDVN